MMEEKTAMEFRAPAGYPAFFYLLLLAWTAGSLPLVYQKFQTGMFFGSQWLYAGMVAFVYVFTWFWSLGIFYRISLDSEGMLTMKSIRRELQVSVKQVSRVEGSRLPNSFGFLRVKLPKESAYIFCLRKTDELEAVLQGIKRLNPMLIRLNI
jgi:hypothetical protein